MIPPLEIYTLGEHGVTLLEGSTDTIEAYYFKDQKIGRYGSENKPCFTVNNGQIRSTYFIGVDWICKNTSKAVYISPKLNKDNFETDYLKMLLVCLEDSEASKYIKDIYEIRTESKTIKIDQSQDLLSPLIVFRFLSLAKDLVKKGLKKSYYRVERNLNARIKGKLLVAQTLKHHTYKNQRLKTRCAFDVFGLDHPENQILKGALQFVQKYLAQFPDYAQLAQSTLDFCLPAFEEVNVPRNISAFRNYKTSPFFSTYKEAIGLAKEILQRHGHNVRTVEAQTISTQPFWINMALLFELYTYVLLRRQFGEQVLYQYKSDYQELDFLLKEQGLKMVIDTKYKTLYGQGGRNKEDIRQLSGYARMEKVYDELGVDYSSIIDCLIAHPIREDGKETKLNLATKEAIKGYVGFYQVGVPIPVIKENGRLK